MSFFTNTSIVDRQQNLEAWVSAFHEQRVNSVIKLVGVPFFGSTKDTNFWVETNTGTGGTAQSAGQVVISTGVTANSTAQYQSVRNAVWVLGTENTFRAVLRLNDTGTANNIRNWGAFDANNGCFFQLNGTTLNVVCRAGGSDTPVAKASWNKSTNFTVDTNFHVWEIRHAYSGVNFYIDGVLMHQITPTTAISFQSINVPITLQNNNSGGSTSNVSMTVGVAMILRQGNRETQAIFKNIHGAVTGTVLKQNAGRLDKVVFNGGGTVCTIWDNTTNSGTLIATMQSPANPISVDFDCPFFTGLTVTTTGAGSDITFIYE